MSAKTLVTLADRLQRKVQEVCRALQNSSGHGSLLPPAIAFLLAEAREDAFELQKEIAAFGQEAPPT